METRDAGRRRGPRRHPRPLRRSRKIHRPSSLALAPPRVRTLAPSSSLSLSLYLPPSSEAPLRPGRTDRRCTSALFFVILLLTPLRFFSTRSCPSPIAFFYRILYFSCRPCSARARLARFFIAYLSCLRAVDPVKRQRRFLYRGMVRSNIQADEYARYVCSDQRSSLLYP